MEDEQKKEGCACMELVLDKLDGQHTDLKSFLVDWKEHRREALQAMTKIDSLHSAVIPLAKNSENLTFLPAILKEMKDVRNTLIGPATGTGRTDNKTLYLILALSAFMVFVLFSIIVIDRLKDSNTSINAKTSLGEVGISGNNKRLAQ